MNQDIQLGKKNTLRILKKVDFGYYLDGGPLYGEILLPNGEITPPFLPTFQAFDARVTTDTLREQPIEESLSEKDETADMVEVFLYLDQEERLIATTKEVLAQVGDFAYLRVAWVNNFGAFLSWGPMKDLFVPFREQKMKMQKDQSYIVHVHLDEESHRIVASAKVESFLSSEQPPYRTGDEVDILIWQKTDLGLKAIIDNQYGGLLYDTQVFRNIQTGDKQRAFVSQVRPDGKVDLMLQRPGIGAATDFSEILLSHLQRHGGHTPLGDKSPAEEIYSVFGVSKKVFKKAVGDLYKRHLIEILPDGLHLLQG